MLLLWESKNSSSSLVFSSRKLLNTIALKDIISIDNLKIFR